MKNRRDQTEFSILFFVTSFHYVWPILIRVLVPPNSLEFSRIRALLRVKNNKSFVGELRKKLISFTTFLSKVQNNSYPRKPRFSWTARNNSPGGKCIRISKFHDSSDMHRYIYTISSTRNSGWDSFRKKKKKKRNKQRKEGRKNKKGREKLKFNGKIFIHVRGKGC